MRQFVRIGITERTPDHSTISRTRRLIDVETHREVFGWVLGLLADRGLLKGKRLGLDATTLEASAASNVDGAAGVLDEVKRITCRAGAVPIGF